VKMGGYWIQRKCYNGHVSWPLKEVSKGEHIALIIDRPYRREFVIKIVEDVDGNLLITKSDEIGNKVERGKLSMGDPFEDRDGYMYMYKD